MNVKCAECGTRLVDGDTAYEQERQVITIRGKTITFKDVVEIVCEECTQ